MRHSASPSLMLVMGASGTVGRHVVDELLQRRLPVRASARRPDPGSAAEGLELVAADLTDGESLVRAFEGVRQVFLYAHPDGAPHVIDAAQRTGVQRIVLLSSGSVVHPSSAGNPIAEEHRAVEQEYAAASDLVVVPIRPLVLATNALSWARPIARTGRLSLHRPDAATAPIHERDVAAVAVAALLGAEDVSDILTGPARISQRDQVAAIAAATGQDLAVDEPTREEASAQLARFMPAEEAEGVLRFLDDAAEGRSPATGAVQRILGRPAIPFADWAREHAAEFRRTD